MTDKKKIIRCTTVPQSLSLFCEDVLKELSEWYDLVAVSSPGKDLELVGEREGVRTIAVPMERRISFINDLKSLIQMIKVFRKEKPKMVHSMTPKAGLICMVAGRLTGVPVRVHTFTGLVWPTTFGLKRKILMATDWLTCNCATHIIPEGKGVMDDLKNFGITKKTLRVLGYGNVRGVDMFFYSRREEVMEIADKLRNDRTFTFIYVGRIVRDKGINELVSAFMNLVQKHPEVRLFLIGPYENELDPVSLETREAIDTMECIKSVGPKYAKDLLSYYVASDCFVMPSYREGFPNTVLEAGALGLPSIVTDINGSREIILEGQNGIIIPSKNTDALYDAMVKMIEDEEAREFMANNARMMINDRYEKSFVRKCLYDFYNEIV